MQKEREQQTYLCDFDIPYTAFEKLVLKTLVYNLKITELLALPFQCTILSFQPLGHRNNLNTDFVEMFLGADLSV